MRAWASLADTLLRNKPIEIWYASLPKRPPQPTAVFASAHALSELSLVREPPSAAVTTEIHTRNLESSSGFKMKRRSTFVEVETSQLTCPRESNSTPSDVQQVPREDVTNDEKVEKASEASRSHILCWPSHNPSFISSGSFHHSCRPEN